MKLRFYKKRLWLWCRSILARDPEIFCQYGLNVKIPVTADLSIRYNLARGRPYEAAEANLINKYVSVGSNVLELGGCYGIISSLIKRKIGERAKHIIVEADPTLTPICLKNANLQSSKNKSQVINAAIDYSGAKQVTFVRGSNAHVGRLAKDGEVGFTIPAATLGSLLKGFPDGPVTLICDIEGAEVDLTRNEHKNLERVELIIIETHPAFYDDGEISNQKLVAELEKIGFVKLEHQDNVICFASPDKLKRLQNN